MYVIIYLCTEYSENIAPFLSVVSNRDKKVLHIKSSENLISLQSGQNFPNTMRSEFVKEKKEDLKT